MTQSAVKKSHNSEKTGMRIKAVFRNIARNRRDP